VLCHAFEEPKNRRLFYGRNKMTPHIDSSWEEKTGIPGMNIIRIVTLLHCNHKTVCDLYEGGLLISRIRGALQRENRARKKRERNQFVDDGLGI